MVISPFEQPQHTERRIGRARIINCSSQSLRSAMVSFHSPLSSTQQKMSQEFEVENSFRKRKLESQTGGIPEEQLKLKSMNSIFNTELHLEAPSPLEWQRCLDIKSGQIFFFNTRTHKREPSEGRIDVPKKLKSLNPSHMSLDLELNLPYGSVVKNSDGEHNHINHDTSCKLRSFGDLFNKSTKDEKKSSGSLRRSPSWLTFDGDEREMITAVCKKCHMLVMMYKSSPECPNCKFKHPPDQSPSLFTPKVKQLSLLC